jgi:hypothetical protein
MEPLDTRTSRDVRVGLIGEGTGWVIDIKKCCALGVKRCQKALKGLGTSAMDIRKPDSPHEECAHDGAINTSYEGRAHISWESLSHWSLFHGYRRQRRL